MNITGACVSTMYTLEGMQAPCFLVPLLMVSFSIPRCFSNPSIPSVTTEMLYLHDLLYELLAPLHSLVHISLPHCCSKAETGIPWASAHQPSLTRPDNGFTGRCHPTQRSQGSLFAGSIALDTGDQERITFKGKRAPPAEVRGAVEIVSIPCFHGFLKGTLAPVLLVYQISWMYQTLMQMSFP